MTWPAQLHPISRAISAIGLPVSEPDEVTARRERICQLLVHERKRIGVHLGFALCPSPTWDVLLDLYRVRQTTPAIQIWSLCMAANIPASTAHRRISEMIEQGILLRSHAGGRVMVSLSADYIQKLNRVLDDMVRLLPDPEPCTCATGA